MQIQLHIERGAHRRVKELLGSTSHYALLTDPVVGPLYKEAVCGDLPVTHLTAPAGEEAKRLGCAEAIWFAMQEANLPRSTLLIAMGGGALCDLGNFVGGCYMRGIDTILIPTTLLAMVDAAVGGKCGVNIGSCKNGIGLIRQPTLTVIDLDLLASLPKEEVRAGMAEVVKAGIIGDPTLFEMVERGDPPNEEVVRRAIDVKLEIVKSDEREQTGERAKLNLGHTFAHAIEASLEWQGMRHGEAVAIGLVCAAALSAELGECAPELTHRIEQLLSGLDLPTRIPKSLKPEDLLNAMQKDKKNCNGESNCVVIKEIGSVFVKRDVSREIIREILLKHQL